MPVGPKKWRCVPQTGRSWYKSPFLSPVAHSRARERTQGQAKLIPKRKGMMACVMTVWKMAYGASLNFSHFEIHSPAWVHQAKSILPWPYFALNAKDKLDPAVESRVEFQIRNIFTISNGLTRV